MYLSKKIKKRISTIMALSMLGGFGLSVIPFTNPTVASAQTTSIDNDAPEDPYFTPIQEPKNVTTLTISPKNRSYLTPDFPMQKIGTTKTFQSKKSSGTIKYTSSKIILTETVNGANPTFTYIKTLPANIKKSELKCSYKKGTTCLSGGFGTDTMSDYASYGIISDISVGVNYLNSTKTQVTLSIPNEYYNQQKKAINDAARAKKKAEADALAKKQYVIPPAMLNSLAKDFPQQPIGSVYQKFTGPETYVEAKYTETGIVITELVSTSNPKFTVFKGLLNKDMIKGAPGDEFNINITCTEGISSYYVQVASNVTEVRATIPIVNLVAEQTQKQLQVEIAKLEAKDRVYKSQQDALDAKIAPLNKQLSTIQTKINTQKKNLTTSEAKVKTLQTQLNTVNTKIKTAQTKLTAANNKVKVLASRWSLSTEMKRNLAAAQAQQKSLKAEITSLTAQKTNITNQMTVAKNTITQAKKQLPTLEKQKTPIQKKINDLKEQKDSIQRERSNLKYDVNEKKDRIEKLNYVNYPRQIKIKTKP